MTRAEIIAKHIAEMRHHIGIGFNTLAHRDFANAIYAAFATPGCEAQGARLQDLPRLAEMVAGMGDRVEALVAERDEARAEVARLRADADKVDSRAFIRGLFWALATHADATGQEEGIATTDIRTIAEAIAAGAEEQDARKLMKRLTTVRERERAAAKAAKEKV